MSNSVTTAIRGSVRDMAIGKIKTTEKADRATVEQVSSVYIVFCLRCEILSFIEEIMFLDGIHIDQMYKVM